MQTTAVTLSIIVSSFGTYLNKTHLSKKSVIYKNQM